MSHPFDTFDKVCIINLASRDDRRREMSEQLQRIGRDIGSANIELFAAVRPPDAGSFPNLGARGCFMSHLGVLRAAMAQRLDSVLILEDDLNFAADFPTRAQAVMGQLAAVDWSMFYGGYELLQPLAGQPQGCVRVGPDVPVRTTHFVALRGPAIASAVAYLEAMLSRPAGHPEGGPMHVDGAYTWFRRAHPQFQAWLAMPELGYQRASRTDIHALRWYDRWPGMRELVATLRRLNNA